MGEKTGRGGSMSAALATGQAPASIPAMVRGQIDDIGPDGTVHGWCADIDMSSGLRRVSILVDGLKVVEDVVCDMFRQDLQAAGIGDGRHGFHAELPASIRVPGAEAEICLLDEASGLRIGRPVKAQWAASPPRAAVLEAHIDQITPEGMVAGWCWDRTDPDRRLVLNVLVDGTQVATSIAGIYREDLHQAGKGTGHCGFSFFLPWSAISSRAEIALTLQDSETGLPVGQRMLMQCPQIVNTEQRIDGLERQLQLVRAELRAAEARAAHAEDLRTAPDLFRLVACFFQDLAEGRPPAALVSLKTRLDDVADRLPLIPFSLPHAPAATIFVLPNGQLDQLHACLAALQRAGADLRARILVLDQAVDDHDDVTLAQAVARNVQVVRLRPAETLNDVLRTTQTEFLALLPCQTLAGPDWLDRLLADMRGDPSICVAASAFSVADGAAAPRHLAADPRLGLSAGPTPGSADGAAAIVLADAVDDLALLLRVEAFCGLGGLDLSYTSLGTQILDFCLRARRAGNHIAYHLDVLASTAAEPQSLLDQCTPQDLARLRAAALPILNVAASSPPRVKRRAVATKSAKAARRVNGFHQDQRAGEEHI
jgi:hypothetical protein